MYASSWRLRVRAMSDMVEATTEAASPSRERKSTFRLCEKIFGHTCWQQSAILYKTPAAKGQTREATSYFFGTLPSGLRDQKKCSGAIFTSFHVRTPSI